MRRLSWMQGVWAALGMFGAVLCSNGCSAPDCVSDEEYKAALARGEAVDLLRCTGNAPLSVSAACTPNSLEVELSDTCGIFVSASTGDDANAGTMENPLKSIAEAITLARVGGGVRVIYLCGETFDQPLAWPEMAGGVKEGVVLFGGLKCDDKTWLYQLDVKTVLTAPEGVVPLRLTSVLGPVNIYDVRIEAMSVSPGKVGVSSIALMVKEATLSLYRSAVVAGDGAPGQASAPEFAAQNGLPGTQGADGCKTPTNMSTPAPTLDCGGGVTTSGGLGGSGDAGKGWDGTSGTPGTLVNLGLGEPDLSGVLCTAGTSGQDGTDGASGAPASGLGTFDWMSGFVGTWGEAGQPGTIAQGGGGGGGSDNAGKCSTANGPSGGSGGTGGCPGNGGKGGGPAGASIAMISFGASLMLSDSAIESGNGGAAGAGAPGQLGGIGGVGGLGGTLSNAPPGSDGCVGGNGGKGGNGGSGGAGLGGHSIGIAYTETAPILANGAVISVKGSAGEGGVAAETQAF